MSVVPGELTTFQWKTTTGQHKPVLKDDKNKKVRWEGRGGSGSEKSEYYQNMLYGTLKELIKIQFYFNVPLAG